MNRLLVTAVSLAGLLVMGACADAEHTAGELDAERQFVRVTPNGGFRLPSGPPSESYWQVVQDVNCRSQPSLNGSRPVTTLRASSFFDVSQVAQDERGSSWLYNEDAGCWVIADKDYVTPSAPFGYCVVSSGEGYANLRDDGNMDVVTAELATTVFLFGNDAGPLRYRGQVYTPVSTSGWIYAGDQEVENDDTITITIRDSDVSPLSGRLRGRNLRAAPSASSDLLGVLGNGTSYYVIDTHESGWVRVAVWGAVYDGFCTE